MTLIAAIGIVISLVIEDVHRRLGADATYASFCNVNRSVNCDVVLTSSYAEVAGVSVSLLAALYYLCLFVGAIAVMRSKSAAQRHAIASAVFALSCIGFAFSFYLAVVAVTVLHAICLLCAALYAVAIGMVVASWFLRSGERRFGRSDLVRHERWLWVASVAALMTLFLLVGWEALMGGQALTAEEIQRERPDYYRHFFSLPTVDVPTEGGHTSGKPNATVTIVEFSDFGCSHCAAFDRHISDLLRRGEDVRVVFRYFPLDSGCNPAISGPPTGDRCLAAVAAECASEQGKFWEYARILFTHQPNFSLDQLLSDARQLGLDAGLFKSCLSRADVRARVAYDAKLGASLSIHSTPTLFLNGRRIEGDPGVHLRDAIVLAGEG